VCFRAWLQEMMSLVRGEGLRGAGGDLEQLIRKHQEYRVQIDRQLDQSRALREEGRSLLEQGNYMSEEVKNFKIYIIYIIIYKIIYYITYDKIYII